MSEPRTLEVSVEVPGTPEEVWDTIATGAGIASWFIPMEVDERVGGEAVMDFGSGYPKQTATITAWEPPRRVVFEGGGDVPLAYEWLVEARDGGTCVVRLVNSGFGTGEGWDEMYDGLSTGWRLFMDNLRVQLTNFRGRRARTIIPTAKAPGPKAAAWSTLCAALGVPADLAVGDRLSTSGDAVPALAGTVVGTADAPAVTTYALLLDSPAEGHGFLAIEGDGDEVAISGYLYLYGPAAESYVDEWSPWLHATFAA